MKTFTDSDESKVFFTSDTHLGHQRDFVWKARGYKSAEDHTNSIIETINAVVRPTDILFHLGDFCLNTPLNKFEGYLSRICCQNIRLLRGNHNNPHEKEIYRNSLVKSIMGQNYNEGLSVYPLRYRNVIFEGDYKRIIANGTVIVLFHYPISVWDEMQNGAWCLCGHSHYHYTPSTAEDTTAKILDVGWDGHKRPLSFEEISAIMAKKQVPVVDHHGL